MQYELAITIHDLKVILNNLVDSEYPTSIKIFKTEDTDDLFLILNYNDQLENVTIRKVKDPDCVLEIPITSIEMLEFQSFYPYKGQSAKILTVG